MAESKQKPLDLNPTCSFTLRPMPLVMVARWLVVHCGGLDDSMAEKYDETKVIEGVEVKGFW